MNAGARVGLFLAAFFAASAVLSAYFPLWLADQGLSAASIGQALGLASILRVIAVPGWGWAADRLGGQRASLFIAAAGAACCAAALPGASSFMALLGLIATLGVASSALAPLTDALALALAAARRLDYGRTRAWGSVAFMVTTAGAGALVGRAGTGAVPWLLAAGYGAAALFSAALPREAAPHAAAPAPAWWWRGRSLLPTLLATALIQGSHAAYYGFAALHWRGAGIADGVIGLLIAEGIIAEVALFIWGRGLVERLGPAGLTGIAASCCLLRWTVTAATVSVPVLATVQLLHAGTFACQHLSAMLVLRALPPGRAAVAQTCLSALGYSGPTAILIWVSGQLYGGAGGGVFLLMAALGGSALLVAPYLPGATRPR